jgi:dGTPase
LTSRARADTGRYEKHSRQRLFDAGAWLHLFLFSWFWPPTRLIRPRPAAAAIPRRPAPTRSAFQRDRDRIVHSTAFRRLVYKTQVFLNHEGDLFRTRLTHSLEVAQLGRSIARSLALNEDLVEAIALAHDLGHTPFGHAGQDALNDCMSGPGREWGGFEHNLQSLRVVDHLEERYPAWDGLNLSFETREGILKHCSPSTPQDRGGSIPAAWRIVFSTIPSRPWKRNCATSPMRSPTTRTTSTTVVRSGLLTLEQLHEVELFRVAPRRGCCASTRPWPAAACCTKHPTHAQCPGL